MVNLDIQFRSINEEVQKLLNKEATEERLKNLEYYTNLLNEFEKISLFMGLDKDKILTIPSIVKIPLLELNLDDKIEKIFLKDKISIRPNEFIKSIYIFQYCLTKDGDCIVICETDNKGFDTKLYFVSEETLYKF